MQAGEARLEADDAKEEAERLFSEMIELWEVNESAKKQAMALKEVRTFKAAVT